MAEKKQDKEQTTKPAEAKKPAATVSKEPTEPKKPVAEVTEQAKPATEVKAEPAPEPAAPRRQSRDQRRRERQEAQAKRQQARTAPRALRPPRAQPETEERTITVRLRTRQWEALDRQLARAGQDEATWFQRFLAPHLRA